MNPALVISPMLKHDWGSTYGPYVDGRRVSAWTHQDLPGWAWQSLLVQGEPGSSGPYMTLPRAAAIDHPWIDQFANHPMIVRWGSRRTR